MTLAYPRPRSFSGVNTAPIPSARRPSRSVVHHTFITFEGRDCDLALEKPEGAIVTPAVTAASDCQRLPGNVCALQIAIPSPMGAVSGSTSRA